MQPHRQHPHVRYATIGHYPVVARDVGLDPAAMLRAHGLGPAPQDQSEQRIPACAVMALLEDTAARSGRDDIGLQMAEHRTIATLGPLSLALREEPDVARDDGVLADRRVADVGLVSVRWHDVPKG